MSKSSEDEAGKGGISTNLDSEAGRFALNLELAQVLWRRYPELVEADQLEEPFLSAFRRECDAEPYQETTSFNDEALVAAGILPKPKSQALRLRRREFNSDGARLSAESLIKSVEFECQDFLARASYIDLQLLYQVLQYHSGQVNETRPNEGVLADGFMSELGLTAPAAGQTTETSTETQRKRPLTLSEVRALRTPGTDMADEKHIADAFTLAGADERERHFLTMFRAIYRRGNRDLFCDDNAPAEKLILNLVYSLSFWPLTLEDVKSELEQNEADWVQRDEAARIVRQELAERVTLRNRANSAGKGAA